MRITYWILLVTLLASAYNGPMLAQGQFPEAITVPFTPEGVAIPFGTSIYVASVFDGQIWRGDVRNGTGEVLVGPPPGMAVGLSYDPRTNYLFVAGGLSAAARVYDAMTGALVRSYAFPAGLHFANDVIVTREGAYITDSAGPLIYKLPLGPAGRLPDAAEEIALNGPSLPLMLNGIEATPEGKHLIVADMAGGGLYRTDPTSGATSVIELGGGSLLGADGLLLIDHTLYVVQGGSNQVSVVQLDPSMATGRVVRTITSGLLCQPATVAAFGPYLYVTNFATCGSETFHKVVRLPRY